MDFFKFVFLLLTSALLFIQNTTKAQWSVSGPFGGSVKCILTAGDEVLIASPTGGIFKSLSNDLSSWKAINKGLLSGKITTLANIGKYFLAGSADKGIFISTNTGDNWVSSNDGLPAYDINILATFGSKIWVGTLSGKIFVSSDTAKSWIDAGSLGSPITSFDTLGRKVIVATYGKGIYYKNKNADEWQVFGSNLSSGFVNDVQVTKNAIFLATESGLYYTSDFITFEWQEQSNGIADPQINGLLYNKGTLYAATSKGISVLDLDAKSWDSMNIGENVDTLNCINVAGSIFITGSSNGIYTNSYTKKNWTSANNGFNNLNCNAILCFKSMVVTATNKGLWVSKNTEGAFSKLNSGLQDSLNISGFAMSETKLFAGTFNAGVFYSNDTGRSWESINFNLTDLSIRKIIIAEDKIIITTSSGRIYSSLLNIFEWKPMEVGLPEERIITSMVNNGNEIYASIYGQGVYLLKSNLQSWEVFNIGLTNLNITSLAILNTKIFAGTIGDGIVSSPLNYPSWQIKSEGLPSKNVTALSSSATLLLAGLTGGICASTNEGDYWRSFGVSDPIPAFAEVGSISISSQNVIIGTTANSLYFNSLNEVPGFITAVSQKNGVGNQILITPNPCKEYFELNKKFLFKELKVMDITGKTIQLIPSNVDNKYNINLPIGLYIIEYEFDNIVYTTKLSVL